MKKTDLKNVINNLLTSNDENLKCYNNGYDKGYAEGYHDALVDVMLKMNIDTDEEWFN